MRRIPIIILLLLALAPAARAQEGNPCQAPNAQATDPNTFWVYSDQLGSSVVTTVTLIVTVGELQEPIERLTMAIAALTPTGFPGCLKGVYSPGQHLLRDGKTIYAAAIRLEHASGLVSPWSTKTPFVLSAPVVEPLRAPTLRLGRTEE